MRQISDARELYGMVCELLVEAICPNCGNVVISTMSQAEMVLVFGCINCADIEQSMLTQMNVPLIEILSEDSVVECITD